MKLASLGLGISALVLLVALLFAWVSGDILGHGRSEPLPESGTAVIDGFTCHRAETRHVVVRGVEDNFSGQGDEPARPHPRLAGRDFILTLDESRFDNVAPDQGLSDYLEFSSRTVSGLIVMKLRPLVNNDNDIIVIGDLTTREAGVHPGRADVFSSRLPQHQASRYWKGAGDLWWVSVSDLPLASGRSLLEAIQGSDGRAIIDVHIGDDTAVDFIATVSCESPRNHTGATLRHVTSNEASARDIAVFTSLRGAPAVSAEHIADPFVGDEPCSKRLPLLCYADRDSPAPEGLPPPMLTDTARHWNGGELAATTPVRGDSFRMVTEADARCAAEFGREWRTAEWADGGFMGSFAGKAGGRRFSGRYWVDIRGQPYATCWRRADGSR